MGSSASPAPTARTVGQYGDVKNVPAWAPDGRWIAVIRSHKGGYLLLLDPNVVRPEVLLEQVEVDELAPFGWSPDGSRLAGTSLDGGLVVVEVDSLDVKPVFVPPAGVTVQFVGWAPG